MSEDELTDEEVEAAFEKLMAGIEAQSSASSGMILVDKTNPLSGVEAIAKLALLITAHEEEDGTSVQCYGCALGAVASVFASIFVAQKEEGMSKGEALSRLSRLMDGELPQETKH